MVEGCKCIEHSYSLKRFGGGPLSRIRERSARSLLSRRAAGVKLAGRAVILLGLLPRIKLQEGWCAVETNWNFRLWLGGRFLWSILNGTLSKVLLK